MDSFLITDLEQPILALFENDEPAHIAIIGGGFCGIMTAIHLLHGQTFPLHIHLINKGYPLARGIAYTPHTHELLLNVPNIRMSAFADMPGHFVRWLSERDHAGQGSVEELTTGFSTRQEYGDYLTQLWERTCSAYKDKITLYDDRAFDLAEEHNRWHIVFENLQPITVDMVVLATGNAFPGFPSSLPLTIADSHRYFADPWDKSSIEGLDAENDIFIIGNGLTMADTVIGLERAGFKQTIHTISPHGCRLQPWKEEKGPYTGADLQKLFGNESTLLDLLNNFNRHRKMANRLDQSVYSLLDSFRPHTQKLWRSLTPAEKRQFIRRLSSFWGSARHRLPVIMLNQLDHLRNQNRLITHTGHIISVREQEDAITVLINCDGQPKQIAVQRIINCTGPESDIQRQKNTLLNNLARAGTVSAGPCGMGIRTHPEDGSIITAKGARKSNLFVIGSNLKGTLWESTAVPELRVQAKKLARTILIKAGNKEIMPVVG